MRLLPNAKRIGKKSHASNTEGSGIFTTSPNKPCCIGFTIPHKHFTDKQVENVRNYGKTHLSSNVIQRKTYRKRLDSSESYFSTSEKIYSLLSQYDLNIPTLFSITALVTLLGILIVDIS